MRDYGLFGGRELTGFYIAGPCEAAEYFADAIFERCKVKPCICDKIINKNHVQFITDDSIKNADEYKITETDDGITLYANGMRGHIFAYSMLLRKCAFEDGKIILCKSIAGQYRPKKPIRGHQMGYRTTPNAYDAWSREDYIRAYFDIMAFGCNTVEHIPVSGKQNSLMKFTSEEMTKMSSADAKKLGLMVSLWYPNSENTHEEAYANRLEVLKNLPDTDFVFPPGGDPGDLPGDVFVDRLSEISRAMKDAGLKAELWPSAQAPHSEPDWGERFIKKMSDLPDFVDGVVYGPNHAFPVHELRRRLPEKYPLRMYTDITHNVRCEYPVHFTSDDWHYALAATLSRESINPRPREYKTMHKIFARYGVGTVTYSEGVNDDINKAVWADMDFFGSDIDLRETLCDYSRFFFPGLDYEKIADIILQLELNWVGDPAENKGIDNAYSELRELPAPENNWRFDSLLFRTACDRIVRQRRIFEQNLISAAKTALIKGDLDGAKAILSRDFEPEYLAMREEIEVLGKKLFDEIGYQLDVARYGADNPERGATLDTIDRPITDRPWLLNLAENGASCEKLLAAINRREVRDDEEYFSVAEHGTLASGYLTQDGEPYINFIGDNARHNHGNLPMSMTKIFDNFSFKYRFGGLLSDTDYRLEIIFADDPSDEITHHKISANGKTIYDGPRYGGYKIDDENGFIPEGLIGIGYDIPKEVIENGTLDLLFSEPLYGVMFSEFRIVRKENV